MFTFSNTEVWEKLSLRVHTLYPWPPLAVGLFRDITCTWGIWPLNFEHLTCRYLRDSIQNEQRNPMTVFYNKVRFINRNKSYLYEPLTVEALERMDPELAFNFYNNCFKNPAQFTICVTGSIEASSLLLLKALFLFQSIENNLNGQFPEKALHRERSSFYAKSMAKDFQACNFRKSLQ